MAVPCKAVPALVAVVFAGWPGASAALDPAKAITQYGHDVWQIEEGLPQNSVRAIRQTRDGYLWLATEEGLARFDGVRFSVFDSDNTPEMGVAFINSLFEDGRGTLWVGTNGGGLLAFRDGRFTAYGPRDTHTLLIGAIADAAAGDLWIGAKEIGLLRMRDGVIAAPAARERLPLTNVSVLHTDKSGTLWIGSRGEGLLSLRDGRSRHYTAGDGLADDRIWSLADAADGALWIGTEVGVSRLASDGTVTNRVLDRSIRAVLEDRDGNLWVGSNDAGLWRLEGGELRHFGKREGLSSESVWSLYEDREGSLWVGTNGGGLNRFRDGAFTTISVEEGLSAEATRCVYQDPGGSVWIGTRGGGVNRIAEGRISAFTTKTGLSKDSVVSVSADGDGAVWFGTAGGGLNRLKDGKVSVFTTRHGLPDDNVFALLARPDRSLWIGTRGGGLSRLQDGRFSSYGYREGLESPYVWALVEDARGTLWIGTANGLFRHAGGEFQELIPEISAHCLHVDAQGTVWIGTAKRGLYRWKADRAFAFTRQHGLMDDDVSAIQEDENGTLWISCLKGICSVSKRQLDSVAEGRLARFETVSYDTADGMKNREASYGTSWKTRDGRLWFPTIRGAVWVDPKNLKKNTLPPPVVVEGVVANGRSLLPSAGQALEVPPGEGRLQFRYTALSLVAPRKVRFAYRLEGQDRDWVDAGTAREAAYTNLRPGHYTFRVKACNNDGVWNESGAALRMHMQPYFYQTGWFHASWLGALALASWQVHRLRMRRGVELERVRTRIAADLHDDIGSGLSQIAVLSEVVRQQFGGDGRASEPLTKIAGTAGELVDSMSDIVWAVNPSKDHLGDLVHRMRRFASDVLTARNVVLGFRADGLDSARRVAPDFRRHVYLIFKESVNNAAKHSGCARVDVAVEFTQQGLLLQVKDDGRGFDPAAAGEGHGLSTLQQRASALGGRLEIVSQPGQGTIVTAQLPLSQRKGALRWMG